MKPERADAYAPTVPVPVQMGAWRERGACKGEDQSLFYPKRGVLATEAKRICARCEVVDECREWACSLPERYGVWGGLSEHQRRHHRIPLCHECGETFVRLKPSDRLCEPCRKKNRAEAHRRHAKGVA